MRTSNLAILFILLLFGSCETEEEINARIAGSYDAFVSSQTEVFFVQLAMNYSSNNEIDGFTMWEGDGDNVEIRLEVDKIGKNKIDIIIPDQSYDSDDNISGSGVIIDNSIELFYIIGDNNFSRSYVLSGNR